MRRFQMGSLSLSVGIRYKVLITLILKIRKNKLQRKKASNSYGQKRRVAEKESDKSFWNMFWR